MSKVYSLLFIINLFSSLSYAAVYPPDLHWKMMKSEHFIAVYHQGETSYARQLLTYAEEAHYNLSSFWNNEMPTGRIYLLLVDNVDYSNGIASIFPYNSITLYLKAPSGEGFLGNNENWLKTVMYHELMHLTQLNQSRGMYRYLHKIFGRHPVLYPNIFQPLWSVEGLATYAETHWTTRGRGRAADVHMLFRMASLADQIPAMDQASGPRIKWPGHTTPYLFGYSFLNYLSTQYPKKNLYEVNKSNSSTIIPFRVYKSFKKAYGKNLTDLWNEWQSDLTQQSQQNTAHYSDTDILLDRGYYITQPVFSSDNNYLYYSISDPNSFPKVCTLNLKQLKEDCFLDRYSGNYLALEQDRLLFSQLERYHTFYTYSDLYSYSLTHHKLTRLTYGMRARDVDYFENGYLFVIDEPGRTSICSLKAAELPCKKNRCPSLRTILKGEPGVEYSSPKWNRQKKLIAASKWENNGIMTIQIFDENGTVTDEIGKNEFRYLSPVWSGDGEYLLFSSDLTGTFNIYAYSLQNKTLCQITNEISGAFYPALSDKYLAFVRYGINGFQLASIPYSADSFECEQTVSLTSAKIKNQTVTDNNYSESNYSALHLLLPRYWTPLVSTKDEDVQAGLFTSGNDLLYHAYSLSFFYGIKSKDYLYDIGYTYDRFYPTIGVRFKKDLNWYSKYDYSTEKTNEFFISFPYSKIKQNTFATVSVSTENIFIRYSLLVRKYSFTWLNFLVGYSNAKKHDYSISPTEGRMVSIAFQDALNRNTINGSLYKTTLKWSEYIPFLLRHHVIAFKTAYGSSWGTSSNRFGYFLGGDVSDPDLLPLRGYKEDSYLATKAFCANIEYRAPLLNIEKGKGNFPVFLQQMHAAAFIDLTKAYVIERQWIFKKGIGAEISLDVTLGYSLNATISAGYARGIDTKGINQFYLRFVLGSRL